MELTETARLRYQPALDGLRAVALVGVIAYHAGIDEVRGGFLGVSSFFTLSGFLITSLLLVERAGTGQIGLASFWARRLRRLLPSALLTIAATVLFVALFADDSQLARLRADAIASLFYFSNWRFIAEGDTYAAVFQSPSPFRHFWSLAVEEQFYLVFPLAVAAALRVCGGPTRRFVVGAVLVTGVAAAWPALLMAGGAPTDRIYFGTDARLGELMVGALLALWWVRRGRRGPEPSLHLTVLGAAAVLGLGWMWSTARPSDGYLYQGGLTLHAGLTIVVILAALAPRGPIRRLLSFEPLRRLGVVSYGAYLIHWPVLLWLQQETSLGPQARFGVGLVVTVALALVMYRWVERPLRGLPTRSVIRWVWVAVPASLTVAGVVLAVTVWRPPTVEPIDFAAAEAVFEAPTADLPRETRLEDLSQGQNVPRKNSSTAIAPETDEKAPVEPAEPTRLAVFGDSTAMMTGMGLNYWSDQHPDELTFLGGATRLGCGLVPGGARRVESAERNVPAWCDTWLTDWLDAIRDNDIDIALVQLGAWEVFDHRTAADGPFRAIDGADGYEATLRGLLSAAVTLLLEHSEVVALVANPDLGAARLDAVPSGTSYPEYDPDRSARWRAVVKEVVAANPGAVVIDLATWIDDRDDDRRLRPDGVHFSFSTSAEVAEWLAPEILAKFREQQNT